MIVTHVSFIRRCLPALAALLACASLMAPRSASAQFAHDTSQAVSGPLRAIGGLLGVGGYFFTSSANSALGSPKFGSETSFFGRPKTFGGFELSGGAQYVSASDHFFPFSGDDNSFSLIGPAFRATTPRVLFRVRPYISGGLFLGQVRSERQGFNRANFAPSISFGAEYPFTRYLTLIAGYRINQVIHGVNTDGFTVQLKVF